jgi:hypothetical protein
MRCTLPPISPMAIAEADKPKGKMPGGTSAGKGAHPPIAPGLLGLLPSDPYPSLSLVVGTTTQLTWPSATVTAVVADSDPVPSSKSDDDAFDLAMATSAASAKEKALGGSFQPLPK